LIYITSLQIDPNPVQTGEIIEVEIEIKEVYKDSKRYPGKYGYRYAGIMNTEGKKYPYKYPRK